ncbi:uncharacterized protein LOC144887749 [Branchiostoma floridae x Branchiostoma japonicum]
MTQSLKMETDKKVNLLTPSSMRSFLAILGTIFLGVLGFPVLVTNVEAPMGMRVRVVSRPRLCDRTSKEGDLLSVHFMGSLGSTDGSVFDSSYHRNQPLQFVVGRDQMIPGWDQGLMDMCVGEKRELMIPPHPSHIAYLGPGLHSAGKQLDESPLVFNIELLDILDSPPAPDAFAEIDKDGDKLLSVVEVQDYVKTLVADGLEIPDGKNMTEVLWEIFQHEDRDRDGFISHSEFSGPKTHDEL